MGENHRVLSLVYELVSLSCPSGLTINTRPPLLKLFVEPNSSSPDVKRSTSPRNGASPNGTGMNMKPCVLMEDYSMMESMFNINQHMVLFLNGAEFKLN